MDKIQELIDLLNQQNKKEEKTFHPLFANICFVFVQLFFSARRTPMPQTSAAFGLLLYVLSPAGVKYIDSDKKPVALPGLA